MEIDLPAQSSTQLRPKKYKKFDKYMASFTFINSCVGSGVLQLGKIAKTAGYVPYFIYYAISITFCFFCFYIFSEACYHGNFPTISAAVKCLYGKVFQYVSDVSILLTNLGFLISYISVSADYLRDGIKNLAKIAALGENLWKYLFKLFVAVGIMCPLSTMRNVDFLNFISFFALIFVFVAAIGVTIRFGQYQKTDFTKLPPVFNDHPFPEQPLFPTNDNITNTIAYFNMFFSLYSLHTTMAPLQRQISGKPIERKRLIRFSYIFTICIVSLIYWWIGTLSAVMFDLDCKPEDIGCIKIDGNVLLNFGSEDMLMTIIKLLYSIVILVSFPCMLFPVRESLLQWFHIDRYTRIGYLYFMLIGWVITLVAMALSIAIPDIDKVFSIFANIFGIIIYELLCIFIWYKMPVLKAHSFGDELQKNIDLVESTNDEESKDQVRSFVEKIEGSRLNAMSQIENQSAYANLPTVREIDEIEQIEQIVEEGAVETKKGKKAKAEKFIDKFVLDNLEKEQFEKPLWRTVICIGGSVFFVCFTIAAIVCEFV